MTHPLVDQFRFTRSEWLRGLKGVTEDEAVVHHGQMNCISWTVGHLAWHEQRTFLERAQGIVLYPEINHLYGYGSPMSSPSLKETLKIWKAVAQADDAYLDTLTSESLIADLPRNGKSVGQSLGSVIQRIVYHYWYHIGEVQAMRQMLGHSRLPVFVGDIEKHAPYRTE